MFFLDLVLIHKVKASSFSLFFSFLQAAFATFIGKDLLDFLFYFSLFDCTLEVIVTLPL